MLCELKAYIPIKNCTQRFITTLFIRISSWQWPKWPSTDERINHCGTSAQTDYYSVTKRSKLVLFATRRCISKVLCSVKEVSLQRSYTAWFQQRGILRKTKYGDDNRPAVASGQGWREGVTAKESKGEGYWGTESILCPVVMGGSYL